MFLPELDFYRPSTFACKDCLESSDLMCEIPIRKSSEKTNLRDLEVSDVIVCAKALRKKVLRKCKDPDRAVQLI